LVIAAIGSNAIKPLLVGAGAAVGKGFRGVALRGRRRGGRRDDHHRERKSHQFHRSTNVRDYATHATDGSLPTSSLKGQDLTPAQCAWAIMTASGDELRGAS
jgi:hypothetical protein